MAFSPLALAVFVVGALGANTRNEVHVTPIAKVLQLLEEMKAKGSDEKKAEEVRFSAFNQWAGDQTRIKTQEIQVATDKIAKLEAEIEKAAVEIAALTARIQELDEDVARWKTDQGSASDVRAKEKADYGATLKDYSESIEAVNGALEVLKKQNFGRGQAEAALLQVKALRLVPWSTKRALVSFLQQAQPDVEAMPDSQLLLKAPEAYGYEFQSGGVVDMLLKLKDEFATKKYELDKEELTAQHAFESIIQQLSDNTEIANAEIAAKSALRAETEQTKATLDADLSQTTADRAEDQKYLDETTALWTQKKADFESRQTLRAEELDVIQKAIDIISSGTVAGAGEKYLPALAQAPGTSFAQLRSGREATLQTRVAVFLADRARRCNSRMLSLAAEHVASDPFVKVKKLIKDLMWKLMEEATAETEHKGWCDTELTTNKQTRDVKTEDVNKLTVEIEDLTAAIAQLTQDIADLSAAVSELDAAMASAEAERVASKEKNDLTVKEAKEAQTAVEQAISVLKDFYTKAAQATAFVQQSPAEDAPETFEKAYTGLLPEGGNIVSFLEVILTDFARLESETAAQEATEVDEYKKFRFESEKDKALKENEISHKSEEKTNKESDLQKAQEELKATQEQLDAAIAYYEKLKPTCVDSGITYEERVKRREEEIQSLQEALKILTGTDVDLP